MRCTVSFHPYLYVACVCASVGLHWMRIKAMRVAYRKNKHRLYIRNEIKLTTGALARSSWKTNQKLPVYFRRIYDATVTPFVSCIFKMHDELVRTFFDAFVRYFAHRIDV